MARSKEPSKGICITLPIPLLEKLNLYTSSRKNIYTSKAIRYILESFFNSNNKEDLVPELRESGIFVPIDIYGEIMDMKKSTIYTKVKSGKIKVVKLYGMDFAVLKKDDIKNIAYQILELRKEVEEIRDILYHKLDEIEDLKEKIESK